MKSSLRRSKFFLFISVLFFAGNSHAQILAWETTGLAGDEASFSATTKDANLASSSILRGSGILSSATTDLFNSRSFNGSATVVGTRARAITDNEYLQFTVNSNPGYFVSLSTLNINLRRSATGPDNFEWQYSLDGFSTPGTTIGSFIFTTIPVPNNGVTQSQINLSLIPALQNIPSGTTVTFRLYAWGAISSTGVLGIGRLPGNDLSIGGSVCTPFTFYADADNDGYGDPAVITVSCIAPPGYVSVAGDCDDTEVAVHPGTTEACNGEDDDCDGVTDEGFTDNDNDGKADCVDPDDDNDGDPDETDCAPLDAATSNLVLPAIEAPADITTANTGDDGNGNCTTIVSLGTPVTNNNCSVHTVKAYVSDNEIDPATYPFSTGVTIVRWEVTDGALRTASDNQSVTVSDNEKPSIDCPLNQSVPFDFGQLYASVTPGSPMVSDNCIAANDIVVGGVRSDNVALTNTYPFGITTITWTATDAAINSEICRQTITVRKRNTSVTYTGAMVNNKVCVQYSDIIHLQALLIDDEGGTPTNINGRTVTFQLWYGATLLRSKSATTNASGIAGDTFKVAQPAGAYLIRTIFTGDTYFNGSNHEVDCTIREEDADLLYSGNSYFSTLSATNFNYLITLAAMATDNNDGSDKRGKIAGSSISPGNALMNFNIWGSANPVNAMATTNRAIGFIDPGDTTQGIAVSGIFPGAITTSEAGNGGKIIEIYAKLAPVTPGSYYAGSSDKQLITIGVPGQDNVTGGGYFNAADPKGIYADPNTPRVNFGFTMKYNKSGKNLMGQANVIFRAAGGMSYQVKSNAINSLTVSDIKSGTTVTGRRAVFNTKANFSRTEILADGTVMVTSLGGNLNLSVEAVQMVDGTKDKFTVTLTDPGGGLLYASNWNTALARSVVQDIANGKINVRGSNTSIPNARAVSDIETAITPATQTTEVSKGRHTVNQALTVMVRPNPGSDKFTLVISGGNSQPLYLHVSDVTGRVIERHRKVGRIIQLGAGYMPGVYIVQVIQGTARRQLRLVKVN